MNCWQVQRTIALRLNLADVTQEPLLAANDAQQRFYLAPSCILEAAIPVLNAVGDVIRMTCHGSGNGMIFCSRMTQDVLQGVHEVHAVRRGWNA